MVEWLHFGVELGWLVDPIAETVSLYRPDQDPEVLTRPSTLSGEPALKGLVVDLTEVWTIVDQDRTNDQ
jgi:Uma2 family endonuclease